ncbi:MAG TPA: thioesterase domain-containing protein, partial [Longimicrobium sp.]|nr:thioesterase domain-containing protein [Longimicrobium sp.]
GEKRLVAYVVGEETAGADVLRAHLIRVLPAHMVPAAFVHLEAMPLTPNGKLDRRALPAPEADAFVRPSYEAPAGETEEALAEIWAEVLRVERVGRWDNFFELGGHSLLAVQVIARMRQVLEVELDLSNIFSHPTVESLSARVRGPGRAVRNDRAIAIRPAGSKLPLFLVHEGTGTTAYAQVLSTHVDGEIPVYALPPQAPSEPPLRTIEGLAARLVRMIREVQSSGPYRVAGWSLGGLLAYEIASQLIDQDEIVEFVGILDGLSSIGPQDVVLNVRRVAGTTGRTGLPESDEEMCVLREYRPQPIPVPVHLFATRQSSNFDPLRGWGDLLPEQLQVTFVPGTHLSMISPPNVETLGKELSRWINHARERVERL